MPDTEDLVQDGPYGGPGGKAYDARGKRVVNLQTWRANYNNYDVLGAIEFGFEDGTSSGRIGGGDPSVNYYPDQPFSFQSGEVIKSMTFYAGDNEGYCDGFKFDTNLNHHFEGGNTEIGKPNPVSALGNGEWAGATGRDGSHGADAVVDNMILSSY
ncbi:uncharacterized protein BO97DRAFT_447207 [Aspergillus homomorphus CBS 101889]|uniref:Jacalin-type lectin domain-containing protein n=1 Tax=Aspergillus homomorphus (strain CBS 101889) TaxID=1450537 RepID=A0A395HKX8_ASPHC|nr:hypothetical protein BO97DRAFT_447207 [Aspergillus homomorphus CBS 101889]RAL06944.1 hypothetical protein BO97DRAFT_447207 [Aspergillus homomorphus CBS 101889]